MLIANRFRLPSQVIEKQNVDGRCYRLISPRQSVPMPGQNSFRCLKFGVFEADLQTGELRKHGLRVRLPRQSFQVLTILLETPGEIVSRDHLRLRVWKGETFIEFDRAINKAIARIRQSLGDTSGVCRREVFTIGLMNKKRDKDCGSALLPWNLSPGCCSRHSGTAAKGMQGENIAVNRLCTGDGSTEAE